MTSKDDSSQAAAIVTCLFFAMFLPKDRQGVRVLADLALIESEDGRLAGERENE